MEVELSYTECAECGLPFALPALFMTSLRKTGRTFHCPNGHTLGFGGGENSNLKKQVENQRSRIECQCEQIERQDKSISNRDGQITKLKHKLSKEKK